jgi:uncharacterized Zn finger protein (UPF0148 family)
MSECKHPRFNKDLYDYCPDCGADWYAAEGGKRIADLEGRIALLESAATRVITPERSEWHPTDYVHVDKKAYEALAALLQEDA